MSRARIVFAGTPDFAVPTLQALLDSPHEVMAVLTQPDRPVGRGRKIVAGPVKQAAVAAGVKVLQPESLRGAAEQQMLRDLQPDLLVVVASPAGVCLRQAYNYFNLPQFFRPFATNLPHIYAHKKVKSRILRL